MREPISRKRLQKWETAVGIACFIAGILAPVLGMFLLAIEWVAGGVAHPWLHFTSTTLFIVGIPLILFAGFCLDWAERGGNIAPRDQARSQGGPKRLIQTAVITTLCAGVTLVNGQQTIFNVPTTDVLQQGKVYLELDASWKPTDGSSVSKFSSFVPRVVVGAGKGIEIGLNVTGNIQPGPDSTTLVPTFKWQTYQGKDNGWAFVVGDNIFLPVRNRNYKAGNYAYAEMSKTFESGTRITFGGYDFTPNVVASANRAGGQFGFEQRLNKKVTFAADWFTGKHAAGYFTPGIIFKLGSKVTGYASYSIGNASVSNGNHYSLLELGYNIN